jgi:glycosyltransferase involved in cell wall biosynthesis
VTPSLSVVLPVYNEREEDLSTTLAALSAGLAGSAWNDPEVVIVDDGSEPPIARPSVDGARVRVLRQPNRGRFEARRAGVNAAVGDYVLLLDARVTLDPAGVRWVAQRVQSSPQAWNGHCMMANRDSPYARFWNVLTYSAFAAYLDDPRTTSFALEDYDRYPKGTGHFLSPRGWLLDAIDRFESRYEDSRFSSDDTHMLRAIASRDRIHISPEFASVYRNRDALRPFLTHAVHRGTTFYDGFFRPGTRFFAVVVLAFPASMAGVVLAIRRPRAAVGAAAAVGVAGVAFARVRGRPTEEALSFGVLVVPFAAAFSAGIWRGAWLSARARARPGRGS